MKRLRTHIRKVPGESVDQVIARARQYLDDPIAPGDWWTPLESEDVAKLKLARGLVGHWRRHPERKPLRDTKHFDGDGLILVIEKEA
ncbi:MAG: hypothetical protein HOP09_14525 [Hyphomicrobium sp.]|nr:hypothetical protein [Hyphomicrobium sp.]